MTDIFHEIEEDLRRDRFNKVWARYGAVFLAIAVLVVAATGAFVWWRGQQQANREAAGETFAMADSMAAGGDLDGARKVYGEIAATGGDGYPALAMFREAALLASRNDVQGALAVYDRIATSAADDRLKALAQIRIAYLVADTEEPAALKSRVAPFADDDNPWRFEARELTAFADFRARENDAAAAAYAAIAADEAASLTMRDRAGKMASFLGGGAILPVEATAPIAPPVEEVPAEAPPAEAPSDTAPPADAPQNP